ncbi:hypothetical protein GWI33_004583 [Rhynchophorus ferrugineus]|uniref:Uncharacterized protein n=1 Tax=Rhynchophorus ferrugineus TaxID=354439 RepID=A0A834IWZ0_RHYFE|nr:hypothetical protein GWI33_004583 [Rhynchophorus ferrugineus]
MQSQKRNSRSYLLKHNSAASQGIRQIFSSKRKLSVASQTDTLPGFRELTLRPFECMSPEETKYFYSRTVHFLNSFHDYMNKTILNLVSKNDFKFPEVSNYYHIFNMIMKSTKRSTADIGIGDIINTTVIGVNTVDFNDLNDVIDKPRDIVGDVCSKKETEVVNCQYLNRNNVGDGPIEVIKFKNEENDIISNTIKDEMFQFDTERRIYWSRTRQVKSERDIRSGNKIITDTSEENVNCCRTFQSCINENIVLNTKEMEEISDSDEDEEKVITTRINSSLNLMEYTLKKLSARPCDDSSDEEAMDEFISPPVPEVICNYFNSPTLNQISHTPHKVNEMFKKISNDNTNSDECKYDNMYIKYISNQNLVDDGSFCENCKKHCTKKALCQNDDCTVYNNQKRWNADVTSSSDCLSSDEEFKNVFGNGYFHPVKESVKGTQYDSSIKEMPAEPVRSHPLELTERDRYFADEKMLKAIGLFTETGEIRPGILEILETEQKNPSQRPSKNVQFRTERKLDVEVRYNNKNINMDANKSDESISDKETYDVHKGESIRSSAVTVSSLISESDLTDMLPPINDIE